MRCWKDLTLALAKYHGLAAVCRSSKGGSWHWVDFIDPKDVRKCPNDPSGANVSFVFSSCGSRSKRGVWKNFVLGYVAGQLVAQTRPYGYDGLEYVAEPIRVSSVEELELVLSVWEG